MDYKITERVRTSFIIDSGRAVSGYRIYFRMTDGTLDYIQIQESQYNAENVKQAIVGKIETHRTVLEG